MGAYYQDGKYWPVNAAGESGPNSRPLVAGQTLSARHEKRIRIFALRHHLVSRPSKAQCAASLALLRTCGKRPACSSATEQRNKLPPPHSITSSAISRKSRVKVRPSAFAAFRLMTSSNLVGCCTGSSAGLAPFRILSTYVAVCRARSARLAP